jgi:hypothetical protein
VTSCEVLLDMPHKWSDHAPLVLELKLPADVRDMATTAADADAEPDHLHHQHEQQQQKEQQQLQQQQLQAKGKQAQPAACPMWQQLLKRFQDPSQKSIAAMFKAAKPKVAAAVGGSRSSSMGSEQHTRQAFRPEVGQKPSSAALQETSAQPQPTTTASAANGTQAAANADASVIRKREGEVPHEQPATKIARQGPEQPDSPPATAVGNAEPQAMEQGAIQRMQPQQHNEPGGDDSQQQQGVQEQNPQKHERQMTGRSSGISSKRESAASLGPAGRQPPVQNSSSSGAKSRASKERSGSRAADAKQADPKQPKLSAFFAMKGSSAGGS